MHYTSETLQWVTDTLWVDRELPVPAIYDPQRGTIVRSWVTAYRVLRMRGATRAHARFKIRLSQGSI